MKRRNMKSLAALTLTTILFNLPAQANYDCESRGNGSALKVIHRVHRLGNAIVVLKLQNQEVTLYGHKTEDGDIFKKEVVTFVSTPASGDLTEDNLTITHSPQRCGRGSCFGGGENILAK